MKWQTCLMASIAGAVMLAVSATAAARPAQDLGGLLVRIKKAGSTATQARYSREVQKSVNAAAIKAMARACAGKGSGVRAQTFSVLGVMRIDGLLKEAIGVPDNAFTQCVADSIATTHFPLPPGNARGWPVGMQFETATGRVLYMAGDRQPAMPLYQSSTMSSMHWAYTPMPVVPATLSKACTVSVWVTVGGQGRVESADTGDSNCPSALNKAVVDATRQWLQVGAHGAASGQSMDVRIAFSIGKMGIRVKL